MAYGSQVWGTSDLNGEVTLTNSNNTLTFQVDSIPYSITIPIGTYKGNRDHFVSQLINPINTQLTFVDAPVFARLGGVHIDEHINVLVLEHKDLNEPHTIDSFGGSGVDTIFGGIQFIRSPKVD